MSFKPGDVVEHVLLTTDAHLEWFLGFIEYGDVSVGLDKIDIRERVTVLSTYWDFGTPVLKFLCSLGVREHLAGNFKIVLDVEEGQ